MYKDDRSPCIQCDRVKRNKSECADSCEKLEMYQESLPQFTLWRDNPSYYSVPGLHRIPSGRIYE